MKKLFILITTILYVSHSFAQSLLNELNLSLKTDLEICIDGEWFDVKDFEIKKIDGRFFEANVKLISSKSNLNDKEYIISNYTPYHIEDGDWQNINGEYQQKGDLKNVHIYHNYQYGSSAFDFKSYRSDGVLGEHKVLNGFSILFKEQENAQKFVSIAHELQGDTYNNTPWLRTSKELASYQGQTSKDVFESIIKDFKQYNIKSKQVYENSDWTKTANLMIKYKYPNIIISYKDVRTTEFYYGNNFKPGTTIITIPINDSRFEFGKGFSGGDDEDIMCIYSPLGLEVSHNGKKDIVEECNFYASKIVCKKLLTKLRVFKIKVLEENYQGEYGFHHSTPKPKSNNKSQELSGGKYVQ